MKFILWAMMIFGGIASAQGKCSNRDDAILKFRKDCPTMTVLGFGGGSFDKKTQWCRCVEKNFVIQNLFDSKCEKFPYMSVWNNKTVKVECGTPSDPL